MVRVPSDEAVGWARQAGGRVVEAELYAALAERHDAPFARRAIAFAVLRGALERAHVGPVAVLNVNQDHRA